MHGDPYLLLARPIQRELWAMGWEALRPIQENAIFGILESEQDLIISARTAAGKTEAAFLPILSRLYKQPRDSIQAIYVGPLKALINDQFRRLEELCARAEISVHRWHGDVAANAKKRLLDRPAGVLLITPESIESLFINRSTALDHLFRHLSFVVIDEIHSLIGRERGTHLRSLLCRLRQHTAGDFRMVGLSATLGVAFDQYARWMRPDAPNHVSVVDDSGEQKRVLYKVHAYVAEPRASADGDEEEDHTPPPGIIGDMFEHFSGRKNLIFANRKEDVEWFADLLNQRCRELGRPPEFLVHHGSLSKEVREFTEQEMQRERPKSTVCSSTLELGIDIGNVSAVGQIDPPWSVSSLIQRLGRSGRADGEPQSMRVYVRIHRLTPKAHLVDRLYPDLLRTIAVTELMLERPSWVEPPRPPKLDFSTLTQQILSALAETGGILAAALHDKLVQLGAFRAITADQFARLLRGLAAHELIEQMQSGELILAPEGEKVANHYSFYSAFATPVEYSVVHGGQIIGTLPGAYAPKVGDHFILGGRHWQTIEIDVVRGQVLVKRAQTSKPPKFLGGGGEIHSRIREMMRTVLLSCEEYPYLNSRAAELLEEARGAARHLQLAEDPLVPLMNGQCLWFTWTGTAVQRTLCLIGEQCGLEVTDRDIAIEFDASPNVVRERLTQTAECPGTAAELAELVPFKQIRKFDEFVPPDLLCEAFAEDLLDLPSALSCIRVLFQG